MKLKIVGIDPALSNIGIAVAEYDVVEKTLTMTDISLCETSPDRSKKVRVNSDDLRRASDGAAFIQNALAEADVVVAEIPTGSQSARGAASYGISIGLLASIGSVEGGFDGSIIQVMPTEVKKAVTGSKHATKGEMIEWATEAYPDLPWLMTNRKNAPSPYLNKNEHMADAVAVIQTGIETDEFKMLTKAFEKIAASQS